MGEVIRIKPDNWLTLKFLKESLDFLSKRNNEKDRLNIKRQKELFKHFLGNP
jgi:hypothetical protein